MFLMHRYHLSGKQPAVSCKVMSYLRALTVSLAARLGILLGILFYCLRLQARM